MRSERRLSAAPSGAALFVAGFLLFIAGPPTAQAAGDCPSGPLSGAFDQTLPRNGSHDADLLGQAVLIETNRARCAEGLAPLSDSTLLQEAAALHSGDMAREDFFSHESHVPGRETLKSRVELVGYRYRRIAENIIESQYMAYRNGEPFYVIDAARCKFTYVDDTPITEQTYASLAREVVRRWMESPGHRANILTPDLTGHGFAIAANRDRNLCGGLYGTQVMGR